VKICADENISPRLVEIVNELSTGKPPLLKASEIGSRGVDDRIWVRVFAEQGGDAIVSADAAMTKRQAELIANWREWSPSCDLASSVPARWDPDANGIPAFLVVHHPRANRTAPQRLFSEVASSRSAQSAGLGKD